MWLLAVVAVLGANPEWPGDNPELPASALADPTRWPDDPEFAPGPSCRGQWGLYSFTPVCAAGVADPEGGIGARVDRAWLWTIGRPEVVIAALDDGAHPDDRDLITKWRLSPGELAPPGGANAHDVNGDGAFNVLDYTTATGTETPTIDRVSAPELIARADRGDANDNGLLDPQDILQIFGDGIDGDDNGFIDDICGWDFVDDDPDPFDGPPGIGAAHWAIARPNNGVGLAGACPECSGLPLRVSERGAAEASALALALLYAAEQQAEVALVVAATWGDRPELHTAIDYARDRRTLVVLDRGRSPGRTAPVSWPLDRVVHVLTVAPTTDDFARAPGFDAPGLCSGRTLVADGRSAVSAPGGCDASAAGLTAGVAGLVWTAAAGLPARGRPAWPVAPTPDQIRGLIIASARARNGPMPTLDARAAVDATLDRTPPPPAVFIEPPPRAVIDPSSGRPFTVRARLTGPRDRPVTWRLEAGPGLVLIASGRIEPDQRPDIAAEVPSFGWAPDPTAPPGQPEAFAVALRLTTRTSFGGRTVAFSVDRTVYVHRDLNLLPAFPVRLPAGVTGAARVVDLENDGRAEIVLTTQNGQILTVTATGAIVELTTAPRWPPAITHQRALAVAGLTDWRDALPAGATARRFNAPPQLWASTAAGTWITWRRDPAVVVGPPPDRPGHAWTPIALDDGALAFFVDAKDRLHSVNRDGAEQPGFPVALGSSAGAPAVGDLDGDGNPDVVVADDDRVWRIRSEGDAHPEGAVWPGWPVELPVLSASAGPAPWGLQVGQGPSVVIADIDNDDEVEIVVSSAGRPLAVFGPSGQVVAVGLEEQSAVTGAMSVGPVDQPDALWSLFSTGRRATATVARDYNADAFIWPGEGRPAGYPLPWRAVTPLEPVLIDVDGDDRAEALWPEGPDRLRALDRDGQPPRGWPKLTGDSIVGTPAVGDLDGDGLREVVVATRRGLVFAWRTRAEAGSTAPWDGHRHDVRGSGDLRSPTRPVPVDSEDGCDCQTGAGRSAPHRWPTGLSWVALLMLGRAVIRGSCQRGRRR